MSMDELDSLILEAVELVEPQNIKPDESKKTNHTDSTNDCNATSYHPTPSSGVHTPQEDMFNEIFNEIFKSEESCKNVFDALAKESLFPIEAIYEPLEAIIKAYKPWIERQRIELYPSSSIALDNYAKQLALYEKAAALCLKISTESDMTHFTEVQVILSQASELGDPPEAVLQAIHDNLTPKDPLAAAAEAIHMHTAGEEEPEVKEFVEFVNLLKNAAKEEGMDLTSPSFLSSCAGEEIDPKVQRLLERIEKNVDETTEIQDAEDRCRQQ